MKKKFLLLLLCLIIVFSCSACGEKSDELLEISKDLTNYTIDLDLNVETKSAEVKQMVDYYNNTGSIIKEVSFHLYPQFFKEGATETIVPNTRMNEAYPNGLSYATFTTKRVRVEGGDVAIKYAGDFDGILRVPLSNSLLPEDRVSIQIDFSFTLPNCEHRFGYGDNTINLANFYPIACVYENGSFNENGYNANGDPFYSDMANYNVNICIDKSYLVASTGDRQGETDNGKTKTINYTANVVRDFAMVASNKFNVKTAMAGNTQVEYYYFDDENADVSLKAGVDSINCFNKLFGTYPYKNLAVVKTDFIQGGMEYPNLIMISSSINNIDDYTNVIVHETAHQWWYGLVGNDEYLYPWLDEALTEYSCLLFYDNMEGYNLTHEKMVEINKSNYSLFVTVYEDVLGTIDTSMRAVDKYDTEPEYTYCTYVKGVLMYESLFNLIGNKAFVKGLNIYFNQNKFTNAEPEDLIVAFEEASKTDLHNFFDSWIKGKVIIR